MLCSVLAQLSPRYAPQELACSSLAWLSVCDAQGYSPCRLPPPPFKLFYTVRICQADVTDSLPTGGAVGVSPDTWAELKVQYIGVHSLGI